MSQPSIAASVVRRATVFAAIVLGSIAGYLAFAPAADALVYWADTVDGKIGRANLNGTGIQRNFITGTGPAEGITVSNTHIYWTDPVGNRIGRAKLDGTGINRNYITGLPNGPAGIAVRGNFIYWANSNNNSIVRVNLNSVGPGPISSTTLLTGDTPHGVAVNATLLYWTEVNSGTIRRVNANFSGAPADLLDGGDFVNVPRGIALTGTHFFWSNGDTSLGRATLDGGLSNVGYIGPGSNPRGVATVGGNLYWTDYNNSRVARAPVNNPAGTYQANFISTGGAPWGVAADTIAVHNNKFRIRKTKVIRKNGTARMRVQMPGPGRLIVTGKGLKKTTKNFKKAKGGRVVVRVRPKPGLKKTLRAKGSKRVKVTARFKAVAHRKSAKRNKRVKLRLR